MNRCILAAALVALMVPASFAQEGDMPMPGWFKLTKEHEDLKKNVGTWDAQMKWYMGPQVMESKGVARAKLIWGGRFLKQIFDGEMMGKPFTGMLLLGFDTIEKRYTSIWLDSASPIISVAHGTAKDGATRLEGMEPDYRNPAGKKHKSITVIKWNNDDQYTITMLHLDQQGKEVKGGEIIYTRRKTSVPDAMKQLVTAEHKALEKFIGTWDTQTDFPGGQPGKGVAVIKKAGHYIKQKYRGTMMGIPFEGQHVIGYDAIEKVYVAVWTDSMNPIMSISRGKAEDGAIVLRGTAPSKTKPGTKEPMILKYKWINDDLFELQFFGMQEGKEAPHGKIIYKRRKG